MIDKFVVKGFKSLEDASIEFGQINVIIGANGSGKSNLLEALGVMGAACFGSVEPETLRYRGVRLGRPVLYKTSLKRSRFRRLISMEASSGGAKYRLALDNPIAKPTVSWSITTESLLDNGDTLLSRNPRSCRIFLEPKKPQKVSVDPHKTMAKQALLARELNVAAQKLISDLENYAIYSPTTNVLRGTGPEEVTRPPLGLLGGGLPQAIKDIVDNAEDTLGGIDFDDIWSMIDWATAVSATPNVGASSSPAVTLSTVLRFRDRYMRSERSILSAYDASEGALFVLFLIALTTHQQAPAFLAIDNFDHALHPRLARTLIKTICERVLRDKSRQILLTTHSPLALDGLDLFDDRIRLFAVERQPRGNSVVNRIEITKKQRDENLSLSRLWVMGRLGGVPELL
jgi:hypothetical protein